MDIQYKSNNFLQEQKNRLLNPELKPNAENYIKYELIDDISSTNLLGNIGIYLQNFMELLWSQPFVVSKILLNASNKEMSEHLSYFFCHNFYENILSPNYIEHNLLFLIALMLKDEINNISNKFKNDPIKSLESFLNNSPTGMLLEQFQKKNDVQTFFNTILLNIIEDLERNTANREIIFDLNKIEEKCKEKTVVVDSRSQSKSLEYSYSFNFSGNFLSDKGFFNNYVLFLDLDYFKKKIESCKNNNNIKTMEYYLYHSNIIGLEKKKDIYSSEIFHSKNTEELNLMGVIDEYITNFDKAINLIDDLLKNLSENFYLLPYSIKCICKIIYSLVDKKFKQFNYFQKYSFMSKFFFEKLFNPIFLNPALGALINRFIISTPTIKNLEEISKIILMFTSGNLYKNSTKEGESYTPFNAYFISKLESLFDFYEEITKVELPLFIQKLINDDLEDNYKYDFFKENPEEVVHHISSCFNADELYIILEIMEKQRKKIFHINKGEELKYEHLIKLEKTFEKLNHKSSRESLKKIRNNPVYETIKIPVYNKRKKEIKEYKEGKGRKIINYFLIYNIILNEEFSKHIKIKQDKKYFNIPEKNKSESPNGEEENVQNKIIKVKNFFCIILYNYRMLLKTDFEEDKLGNTINILKELKKLMRSSNNMLNVNFPAQWYAESLLDYLGKIPKKFLDDDCEFLINELQNDVDKSIKSINFEDLSILIDKMKFATRGKNFYENVINLVRDMKMNKSAQIIMEKENLEIEIFFRYNDKKKEFKIYKPVQSAMNLEFFDNILEAPKEKGIRECNSISAFTMHFPNFKRYQEKYKKDNLFDFLKELKVPKHIDGFFKIIKDTLKSEANITDEKDLANMNDKIYDYVMEKLYEKIFPTNTSYEDEKIYQICEKLKDNEPGFFIKTKKSYIFESFLPDLTNYLLQIEKEKSVRKKFWNLKKIFESMNNLSSFSGGDKFDLDTQVSILTYVLVKAEPKNIYTNYCYMDLFIADKKAKIEGQNLLELKLVCEHLLQKYSNQSDKNNKK